MKITMCGQCIEPFLILNFVEPEFFSDTALLHADYLPNCIQETHHISDTVLWGKENAADSFLEDNQSLERFHGTVDVAFCRLWETLLDQGDDSGVYQTIVQAYGEETINKFLGELRSHDDCQAWMALGDRNLYEDRCCWNQFIGNKQQLIRNAGATLEFYYNWWILGTDKKAADLDKNWRETGIMDPIDNTEPVDWDRFYDLFPFVYFSFLILSMHTKNADIIRRIAIEEPHDVPDFAGYDLWLKRKTFSFCVKEYGVRFIVDNYSKILNEMIYYCLLKGSLRKKDLGVLKNFLLSSQREQYEHVITTDEVIQLIDKLGR